MSRRYIPLALGLGLVLLATPARADPDDPSPSETGVHPIGSSSDAPTVHDAVGALVRRIVRKVEADEDGDIHIEVVGGRSESPPDFVEATAILVPLAFFGTILGSIALVLMFRTRSERIRHETVRLALDKGQDIPSELLLPRGRRRSDLRRGLVLACGGVGLAVMLAVMGNGGSRSWALGIFPLMVGLGYLAHWWVERDRSGQDRSG